MNEKEYNNALSWIKKADPENGWLADLMKGYSAVRVMYMNQALEELKSKALFEEKPDEEKPKELTEAEVQQLRRSITKMYVERAIMSNSFHACATDKERIRVSNTIQLIQSKIKSAHLQIEFFEEHGALPADPAPELTGDRYDMHKKIRSLGTQLSRLKRKLETCTSDEEREFYKQKIKQYATRQENYRKKSRGVQEV